MAYIRRSVAEIITAVASNDHSITSLDFSGQASYQIQSKERTKELSEALERNTIVTVLKLKDCAINDAGAASLGAMFAKNCTLEDVDLSSNGFKLEGSVKLAEGLASNANVRQLDLTGMPFLGKSAQVLSAFIEMYQSNFCLKKIIWRLEHNLAHTLARLMTRNNSIARRIEQGKPFDDLMPDHLKGQNILVLGASSLGDGASEPAKPPTPTTSASAPAAAAADSALPEPVPVEVGASGYASAQPPEAPVKEAALEPPVVPDASTDEAPAEGLQGTSGNPAGVDLGDGAPEVASSEDQWLRCPGEASSGGGVSHPTCSVEDSIWTLGAGKSYITTPLDGYFSSPERLFDFIRGSLKRRMHTTKTPVPVKAYTILQETDEKFVLEVTWFQKDITKLGWDKEEDPVSVWSCKIERENLEIVTEILDPFGKPFATHYEKIHREPFVREFFTIGGDGKRDVGEEGIKHQNRLLQWISKMISTYGAGEQNSRS